MGAFHRAHMAPAHPRARHDAPFSHASTAPMFAFFFPDSNLMEEEWGLPLRAWTSTALPCAFGEQGSPHPPTSSQPFS